MNRLKVAWVLQFGTLEAQESTPVVVGDTLYVTTSAGPRYVYAVNAKTGAIRWKYAPEIPPDVQQTTCCGLDNRGVAYAHGKLFVARLDADTGKIVWHYQTTPYDVWDYDGVNELVLVDAPVDGQKTPLALKADRNGFFYVLNRKTGQLVSAHPFVLVNWAKGIDRATGRPIEVAEKRPRQDIWARDVCPNLFGGKNWEPMSYSPQTGFVYIPTFNLCMDIVNRPQDYKPGTFFLASEFDLAKAGPGDYMSELVAWDPIKQQKVWGSKEELPFMGGALSTAGGLVFHGNVFGIFKALDAWTGKVLWQFNTGSGITAGPATYEVDGTQYVAVVSGRLKTPPSFLGWIGEKVFAASPEGGALFVFELQ